MSGPAVNIITGFLGSGKTTLLKHVLQFGLSGKRIALIINEMADLGIDGRLVECANVEQMIELNNGCICCTINREFASAIQSVIETIKPHLIIIETTGIAEVEPLINEIYTCGLRLDACITVIDSLNFLETYYKNNVVLEQITSADFLVLNKIDLVTTAHLDKVKSLLGGLNSRASMIETTRGTLESDVLFATSASTFHEKILNRSQKKSNHIKEGNLTAFSYKSTNSLNRSEFEKFLENLPLNIYRAKGIIRFTEELWPCLFNYTCGRYEIDPITYPLTENFSNQAIFIGNNISEVQNNILDNLKNCEKKSDES